jgi:hypothetical protein
MVILLVIAIVSVTGSSLDARQGATHEPVAAAEPEAPETIAARRDSLEAVVLESIRGREQEPAGEVFENLQIERLQGMPAGRIPRIMSMGFSRSLGVSCEHCHEVGAWARDAKHEKQVAREMFAMVGTINGELLAGIEGLESDNPTINCTTCHRGEIRPAK